jgi:predicted MPP superfamily phosphohydrolase
MDHQPVSLAEAAENNIDLQISGHTHHGQMWPLQLVTERVFKLSWGYKKIGNSHFYVSSGAGTWGPRVRLGNHPEIVSVKLRFI